MTQPRGGPLSGWLPHSVLPVEHLAREDEGLYDIRLHLAPNPVLLDEPIGIPVTTEYLYSLGVRHGCRDLFLLHCQRVIPTHHFHEASFHRKLITTLLPKARQRLLTGSEPRSKGYAPRRRGNLYGSGTHMNPRDFRKAAPYLGAILLAALVFIVVPYGTCSSHE